MSLSIQFAAVPFGDKPASVFPPPVNPTEAGNHSVSARSLPAETAATLTVSPTADVAADNFNGAKS